MNPRTVVVACVLLVSIPGLLTADPGASQPIGWRGNETGLFPDAKVPAEWSYVSAGAVEGMKCAAEMPADGSDKNAETIERGLITKWLVVGPIAVEDSAKAFDEEQIAGEAKLAPRAGDKAGDLEWKPAEPKSDGVGFWNVNLTPGKNPTRQVGYATTCLYARKAGKVRAIMEHVVGVRVWVNGKEAFIDKKYGIVMGSAYGQSANRVASTWPIAPPFEFDVVPGWNRLTIKLVAPNNGGWNDLAFYPRIEDPPTTPYLRKNIAWMTPLPDKSNAGPIIVGDKVFVTSEPDELICVDKRTGKVLWNAMSGYYDAIPQAERDANPVFKEKIDPLAKALKDEPDPVKRWTLRRQLNEALVAVNKEKYKLNFDGHLAAHFEIVGFSTTPVSDGKHVFVWTGAGVAACYDLDGKRVWIRRLEADQLFYSASPAVIGGKLAVYFRQLYGLDAKTGEIAWKQPEVNMTVASLLSARIANTDVFISQKGEVVRASDGKMLWKNPHKHSGDTGWAAPTVIGDVLYVPWNGITTVLVWDFAGCAGDEWKPKVLQLDGVTAGAPREKGDQGDPWMAGSVLIHDGLLYAVDIHARYFIVDLKTGKQAGWRRLDLPGESSYVALRVAAGPTLVGKFIVTSDNQGHFVVLEPGVEMKEIGRNRLATQIPRDWAISTQEFTGYSSPVPDGNRMYIRGERYLYCIGAQ